MMKPVKTKTYSPAVAAEMEGLLTSMLVTDVRRFDSALRAMKNGRGMYERVSKATGIPWWFVGVIHGMECGYSFRKHLHNGDSLKARTRHVPAGRPVKGEPPFDWDVSAIDALTMPGKRYDRVTDWSMPHALWLLEKYNGLGYRLHHAMPSPYLWAGTNNYTRGKYVADGVWDPKAVSRQAGCAGVFWELGLLKVEVAL